MLPQAIYVLGGGLVCEGGIWRTTWFDEQGDAFGALGDRLRVEAAAVLAANNPDALVVVSGGKGQLRDNPDAPTIASILRKELIELGVPEVRIFEESTSNNTYEQLRKLVELCAERGWAYVEILTNTWHIPRTNAFLEVGKELECLARVAFVVSAEDILISHARKQWEEVIHKAYQDSAMKERYAKEEKGIAAIRDGTYVFR